MAIENVLLKVHRSEQVNDQVWIRQNYITTYYHGRLKLPWSHQCPSSRNHQRSSKDNTDTIWFLSEAMLDASLGGAG